MMLHYTDKMAIRQAWIAHTNAEYQAAADELLLNPRQPPKKSRTSDYDPAMYGVNPCDDEKSMYPKGARGTLPNHQQPPSHANESRYTQTPRGPSPNRQQHASHANGVRYKQTPRGPPLNHLQSAASQFKQTPTGPPSAASPSKQTRTEPPSAASPFKQTPTGPPSAASPFKQTPTGPPSAASPFKQTPTGSPSAAPAFKLTPTGPPSNDQQPEATFIPCLLQEFYDRQGEFAPPGICTRGSRCQSKLVEQYAPQICALEELVTWMMHSLYSAEWNIYNICEELHQSLPSQFAPAAENYGRGFTYKYIISVMAALVKCNPEYIAQSDAEFMFIVFIRWVILNRIGILMIMRSVELDKGNRFMQPADSAVDSTMNFSKHLLWKYHKETRYNRGDKTNGRDDVAAIKDKIERACDNLWWNTDLDEDGRNDWMIRHNKSAGYKRDYKTKRSPTTNGHAKVGTVGANNKNKGKSKKGRSSSHSSNRSKIGGPPAPSQSKAKHNNNLPQDTPAVDGNICAGNANDANVAVAPIPFSFDNVPTTTLDVNGNTITAQPIMDVTTKGVEDAIENTENDEFHVIQDMDLVSEATGSIQKL